MFRSRQAERASLMFVLGQLWPTLSNFGQLLPFWPTFSTLARINQTGAQMDGRRQSAAQFQTLSGHFSSFFTPFFPHFLIVFRRTLRATLAAKQTERNLHND